MTGKYICVGNTGREIAYCDIDADMPGGSLSTTASTFLYTDSTGRTEPLPFVTE
jgi:hypothetical protein